MKWYFDHKSRGTISIPTGGGKTLIFSSYAEKYTDRALVLAHRDELVSQTEYKAKLFYKPDSCGIIQGKHWQLDRKFISGSIQTLVANRKHIKDVKNLDLIVVDEAHHLPAKTYSMVVEELLKHNRKAVLLGATATPYRADDKALSDHYGEIIYSISTGYLQKNGYLLPAANRYTRISREESDRIQKIAKYIEKNRDGRKTISFLQTVEESKELAKILCDMGLKAQHVDGKTPSQKRRTIVKKFRSGKIEVLTNVLLFTEGYDDPTVECIHIDRQVDSIGMYVQIVGRGLRLSPLTGKRNCLVLDTAGNPKMKDISNMEDYFYSIKERVSLVDLITQVNRKNIIASCGIGRNFILMKMEKVGGFSVYVVNPETLYYVESYRKVPYEIAIGLVGDLWLEYRGDELEGRNASRLQQSEPTHKQLAVISRFRHYFSRECIEKKISRYDAMNMITYINYRMEQYKRFVLPNKLAEKKKEEDLSLDF
jgi:hypothetical protein